MVFLLDTHALIWAVLDNPSLSSKARKQIIDTENTIYFSIASLWEITIKHSIGALELKTSLSAFFQTIIDTGFTELTLTQEHLLTLNGLPFHHKDPFDRILVSQAICENVTFITKDALIPKYDVVTLW